MGPNSIVAMTHIDKLVHPHINQSQDVLLACATPYLQRQMQIFELGGDNSYQWSCCIDGEMHMCMCPIKKSPLEGFPARLTGSRPRSLRKLWELAEGKVCRPERIWASACVSTWTRRNWCGYCTFNVLVNETKQIISRYMRCHETTPKWKVRRATWWSRRD